MKQTEIKFFWPLTEQIPLDLDYKQSEEFYKYPYGNLPVYQPNGTTYTVSGGLTTNFSIMPSSNHVGHWEVNGKDFQVYREKRPSWIHRTFNKLLLGWVWVDN